MKKWKAYAFISPPDKWYVCEENPSHALRVVIASRLTEKHAKLIALALNTLHWLCVRSPTYAEHGSDLQVDVCKACHSIENQNGMLHHTRGCVIAKGRRALGVPK